MLPLLQADVVVGLKIGKPKLCGRQAVVPSAKRSEPRNSQGRSVAAGENSQTRIGCRGVIAGRRRQTLRRNAVHTYTKYINDSRIEYMSGIDRRGVSP